MDEQILGFLKKFEETQSKKLKDFKSKYELMTYKDLTFALSSSVGFYEELLMIDYINDQIVYTRKSEKKKTLLVKIGFQRNENKQIFYPKF
jgi:hypothetical protein